MTFRDTKNKEDRKIPIANQMAKRLQKLIRGRRAGDFVFRGHNGHVSRITAYKALKLRLERAGVDKEIHPHSFRHAFITDKLRRGKPLPAVQKFVGHKSLQSTAQYVHFTMDDLREVLNP